MAERQYISTKNESVRMFESNFMEFFSHVHPATPVIMYTPVIGYMLYVSFAYKKFSVFAVAGLFVVGMLIWTLWNTSFTDTFFTTNQRPVLENFCIT